MNSNKYLVILGCFATFACWFLMDAYSMQMITAVTSGDQINVREKPDLKSKVITQINKNIVVEILDVNKKGEWIDKKYGNWVYIEAQNQDKTKGWVFDAFLSYNYMSSLNNKYVKKVRFENNP